MKTRMLGLLILSILFCNCKKGEDITVVMKQDGSLSVKLIDDKDSSIANTKVKLYDIDYSGSYINAFYTNKSGVADFGEVLVGTYKIVVDTPKVGRVKYAPVKVLQVVSGSSKNEVVNVQEYDGTLKISYTKASYLGGGVFAGVNTLLVPNELYNTNLSINELIKRSEFYSRSNAQGTISIVAPSSRDFRVVIYNDKKYRKNAITTINLLKDELKVLAFKLDTSLVVTSK